MKAFLYVLIIFFMSVTFALAGQIHLAWDAPKIGTVTGYRLYYSANGTFPQEILLDNIPSNQLEANVTVPDHKLVLIRVVAFNDVGESKPVGEGVFYHSDWFTPEKPVGLGIMEAQ